MCWNKKKSENNGERGNFLAVLRLQTDRKWHQNDVITHSHVFWTQSSKTNHKKVKLYNHLARLIVFIKGVFSIPWKTALKRKGKGNYILFIHSFLHVEFITKVIVWLLVNLLLFSMKKKLKVVYRLAGTEPVIFHVEKQYLNSGGCKSNCGINGGESVFKRFIHHYNFYHY